MGRPGRPRMSREELYWKYHQVIFDLNYMVMSLRQIALENKVSLSTVQRLKKKFYKKI